MAAYARPPSGATRPRFAERRSTPDRFTSGDPNGADQPDWPLYDRDGDVDMTLADPLSMAAGLSSSDCDFWDRFVRAGGVINLGL